MDIFKMFSNDSINSLSENTESLNGFLYRASKSFKDIGNLNDIQISTLKEAWVYFAGVAYGTHLISRKEAFGRERGSKLNNYCKIILNSNTMLIEESAIMVYPALVSLTKQLWETMGMQEANLVSFLEWSNLCKEAIMNSRKARVLFKNKVYGRIYSDTANKKPGTISVDRLVIGGSPVCTRLKLSKFGCTDVYIDITEEIKLALRASEVIKGVRLDIPKDIQATIYCGSPHSLNSEHILFSVSNMDRCCKLIENYGVIAEMSELFYKKIK